MMDKTKRIFRIYLTGTLLLAIAVVVLRTVALFSAGFDHANGYFALHSLPHEIARLATVIGVILILTQLAPLRGKMEVRDPGKGLPVVFSVALAGILVLAFSLFRVFELHLTTLPSRLTKGTISTPAVVFCFATAFFGAVAAACSVFSVAKRQVLNAVHALAAMSVSLLSLFYSLFLYFDYTLPMNADVKIASQAAFLSVALFFLCEARISLDRPMWTLYAAVGMISLLLTVTVAVPDLIYALVRQTPVLDSAIDDFLLLGFAIYILAHFSALTVKPIQTAGGIAGRILAETEAAAEDEPLDPEDVEQISFFGDEPRPVETPVQNDVTKEEDDEDDLLIFASPEISSKRDGPADAENPAKPPRFARPATGTRAPRASSKTNKKQ
ncbi:MAG: hypothetical protein J6Z04_07915 [Clostridia bacterium]|nr:hypothetical protein [Clostridia bacterium]